MCFLYGWVFEMKKLDSITMIDGPLIYYDGYDSL